MKISNSKFDLILAKKGITRKSLNNVVSETTLSKIKKGTDILPKTVGKIARALNVDVEEIIEKEV